MAIISKIDNAQLSMMTMSSHHRYEHESKAGDEVPVQLSQLPRNVMEGFEENTMRMNFLSRGCRGCVGAKKQFGHKAQISFASVVGQYRALENQHCARAGRVQSRQTGDPELAGGGTQRRLVEVKS